MKMEWLAEDLISSGR